MTAIRYPDFSRTSENGRFRLDVRSPDNLPEDIRRPAVGLARIYGDAFQHDFVYVLTDCVEERGVWRRNQPAEGESSPWNAFVSDCGWVIIHTHDTFFSNLLFLAPDGTMVRNVDVVWNLLEGDKNIGWSSAGPFWAWNARTAFVDDSGSLRFCMRLKSGRQLVFELTQSEVRVVSG